MYLSSLCYTGLLAVSLVSLSARATDVAVTQLPSTIQSCVAVNSCSVVNASIYDSGTVSAFGIYNNGQAGFNYLVRYALVPPSGQTSSNTDFYQNPPVTTSSSTPFTGYLWMQVQGSYSASKVEDPITLYLDKVSPVPTSFYNQNGDLSLFVTPTDLLAGSSYINSGLDINNHYYVSGSLSGEVPIPCVAEGCSAFAQLNLAQLQFTSDGTRISTGFNSADSRGQVFALGTAYDTFGSGYSSSITQSFYISSVPDSEPVWLFSTGLICLAAVMKRKQISPRKLSKPYRSYHGS